MAAELHTEGLQYILEAAISQTQSVPAAFYLGWCTEAAIDENASLADLTELAAANGYARVAINSDGTDWISAGVSTNAWKVTSKTCTFTPSGGDWAAANSWFLATTADDTGKLIASGPLNSGAGITLLNGQSYDVVVVITLTITSGWTQEGLQYLLEVAFTEAQNVPANFYRGLAMNTTLASNATLASVTELPGTDGYARQNLQSDGYDWTGEGEGDGDYQLVTDESAFENTGAAWLRVLIEFICTSSDGSGKLLCWRPLDRGSGVVNPAWEAFDTKTSLLLTG